MHQYRPDRLALLVTLPWLGLVYFRTISILSKRSRDIELIVGS